MPLYRCGTNGGGGENSPTITIKLSPTSSISGGRCDIPITAPDGYSFSAFNVSSASGAIETGPTGGLGKVGNHKISGKIFAFAFAGSGKFTAELILTKDS